MKSLSVLLVTFFSIGLQASSVERNNALVAGKIEVGKAHVQQMFEKGIVTALPLKTGGYTTGKTNAWADAQKYRQEQATIEKLEHERKAQLALALKKKAKRKRVPKAQQFATESPRARFLKVFCGRCQQGFATTQERTEHSKQEHKPRGPKKIKTQPSEKIVQ